MLGEDKNSAAHSQWVLCWAKIYLLMGVPGKDRRPIVEFAIENAQTLKKRAMRWPRDKPAAADGAAGPAEGAPPAAAPAAGVPSRTGRKPRGGGGKAAAAGANGGAQAAAAAAAGARPDSIPAAASRKQQNKRKRAERAAERKVWLALERTSDTVSCSRTWSLLCCIMKSPMPGRHWGNEYADVLRRQRAR